MSTRTRLLKRIADQAVREALSGALDKITTNAAAEHPKGRMIDTVRI